MRSRSLDVLRAIAVVLVMLYHFAKSTPFGTTGWMGVDLFFVLSGYLVSGLLFDELNRNGDVRPWRFLARRAFKIYPSFWIMIAATAIFLQGVRPIAVVCELLFLQNYGPGLYGHTWSLAVEEHFYLMVAAAFALRSFTGKITTRAGKLGAFATLLLGVLCLRILNVLLVPARYKMVTFGTHVRVDALICGVAIAWMLRDEVIAPRLRAFVERRRALLLVVCCALVAPACVLGREHFFVETIGLTLVYLGCAALLLVTLSTESSGPLARAIATVGRSSYSIYLWHLPIYDIIFAALAARGILPAPVAESAWFAIPVCIALGIAGTHLIETPFLRLRDRVVPAPRGTTRGPVVAT